MANYFFLLGEGGHVFVFFGGEGVATYFFFFWQWMAIHLLFYLGGDRFCFSIWRGWLLIYFLFFVFLGGWGWPLIYFQFGDGHLAFWGGGLATDFALGKG